MREENKRVTRMLAAVCLLHILAGCAQVPPVGETTEPTVTMPVRPAVPPEFGIVLEVQDVTPAGMTVLCTRQGETWLGGIKTGMPEQYRLEVWDGSRWLAVPSEMEVTENPSLRVDLAVGEQISWKIDWQKRYGLLPEGTYRYVRKFWDFRGPGQQDWRYYSVPFEVTAAE